MKQMVEALEIAAEGGGVDFYAYAKEGRQAIAEAEKQPDWKALVLNHNADCDARCNMDRCGYKPYYENNKRRCPNCPVYEKIEL